MAEQPDMPDRSGIVVGCELASQLEPRDFGAVAEHPTCLIAAGSW